MSIVQLRRWRVVIGFATLALLHLSAVGACLSPDPYAVSSTTAFNLLQPTGCSLGSISVGAGITLSDVGNPNATIQNEGTITTITNNGTISGSNGVIYNSDSSSSITTIINTGTLSSTNFAIANRGTIDLLNNSGTISGRLTILNQSGTITTLTNTGNIVTTQVGIINQPGFPPFMPHSVIGTLNNLQGASGTALTYQGRLPEHYNVIINSPSDFGRLSVASPSGSTIFGIYAGSTVTNGTYSSVLSGLTLSHLTVTSGTYGGGTWSLLNSAGSVWDLVLSGLNLPPSSPPPSDPLPSNIGSGDTVALSSVGTTANPVLSGGTLTTLNGEVSSLAFAVPVTSAITAPTTGAATLSGVFSGSGGLTFTGAGTVVMSGANTYSGGTTVSAGTLSISGTSPTGTGDVFIATGATLMGRGLILGRLFVAGTLKPGNSPGYLSTSSTFTMNTGSTYLQDIAGTNQASSTSPVSVTGYYSFLNVTNGQFVIQSGVTLTPQLSNLFTVGQSGYGSAIYVPALGDRFRMVTASGGISGRFSTFTQPAELAAGTQLLPFYNMAGSNSLDLAVIPSSYVNTITTGSGNANAQSVGSVLMQSAQNSLAGNATGAQEQLLYSISRLTTAQSIVNVAQSLAGEVYAATVAVIAQTTQRLQQAVLSRLSESAGSGLNMSVANLNSAPTLGGAPTAAMSSNPNVNPNAEAKIFSNGNVWGDLAYQRGNRSGDQQSGGWNSNLYQLTFGSDFYSSNGTTLGGGFALSSTTLNPVYGSATIQQGSLFAYGKTPIDTFVVDAMASIGLSSSDISRGDITGLSTGFRNKTVSGNDALISLGLSRPIEMESVRITPYARVTWQMVTQSAVNEGDVASALTVNRYTGNGVRGVIGVAAGSKAHNPMMAKHTYRAYVGIGADSSGLLNPTLNASLLGIGNNISTPNAGTTFVLAGVYGTAKLSENTFAYAGIAGEARSGQTLGTVNVGLKVQF